MSQSLAENRTKLTKVRKKELARRRPKSEEVNDALNEPFVTTESWDIQNSFMVQQDAGAEPRTGAVKYGKHEQSKSAATLGNFLQNKEFDASQAKSVSMDDDHASRGGYSTVSKIVKAKKRREKAMKDSDIPARSPKRERATAQKPTAHDELNNFLQKNQLATLDDVVEADAASVGVRSDSKLSRSAHRISLVQEILQKEAQALQEQQHTEANGDAELHTSSGDMSARKSKPSSRSARQPSASIYDLVDETPLPRNFISKSQGSLRDPSSPRGSMKKSGSHRDLHKSSKSARDSLKKSGPGKDLSKSRSGRDSMKKSSSHRDLSKSRNSLKDPDRKSSSHGDELSSRTSVRDSTKSRSRHSSKRPLERSKSSSSLFNENENTDQKKSQLWNESQVTETDLPKHERSGPKRSQSSGETLLQSMLVPDIYGDNGISQKSSVSVADTGSKHQSTQIKNMTTDELGDNLIPKKEKQNRLSDTKSVFTSVEKAHRSKSSKASLLKAVKHENKSGVEDELVHFLSSIRQTSQDEEGKEQKTAKSRDRKERVSKESKPHERRSSSSTKTSSSTHDASDKKTSRTGRQRSATSSKDEDQDQTIERRRTTGENDRSRREKSSKSTSESKRHLGESISSRDRQSSLKDKKSSHRSSTRRKEGEEGSERSNDESAKRVGRESRKGSEALKSSKSGSHRKSSSTKEKKRRSSRRSMSVEPSEKRGKHHRRAHSVDPRRRSNADDEDIHETIAKAREHFRSLLKSNSVDDERRAIDMAAVPSKMKAIKGRFSGEDDSTLPRMEDKTPVSPGSSREDSEDVIGMPVDELPKAPFSKSPTADLSDGIVGIEERMVNIGSMGDVIDLDEHVDRMLGHYSAVDYAEEGNEHDRPRRGLWGMIRDKIKSGSVDNGGENMDKSDPHSTGGSSLATDDQSSSSMYAEDTAVAFGNERLSMASNVLRRNKARKDREASDEPLREIHVSHAISKSHHSATETFSTQSPTPYESSVGSVESSASGTNVDSKNLSGKLGGSTSSVPLPSSTGADTGIHTPSTRSTVDRGYGEIEEDIFSLFSWSVHQQDAKKIHDERKLLKESVKNTPLCRMFDRIT
jgi:hypothetical protein